MIEGVDGLQRHSEVGGVDAMRRALRLVMNAAAVADGRHRRQRLFKLPALELGSRVVH